jgi:hypothetical protein
MKRTLLILGLLSITFCAEAAVPPPKVELSNEAAWAASMQGPPSAGLTLGAFTVQLEKTTLAQVMDMTAVGTIANQGDAGESTYWLCYTLPEANERVWITSGGEMGGPEHKITHIIAQKLKSAQPSADCPSLPTRLRPVSLSNHLWLGSTNADVQKALKCEGGYDVTNWLWTKSTTDRVEMIDSGEITSC